MSSLPPKSRPIVVGISGASCSGKTWLARTIFAQNPEACEIIDLDGYYRELDEVTSLEHGHDNPAAINFDRAVDDLRQLKNGCTTPLPVYSYEHHRNDGVRECQPRPILLLEGIFVFADPRLRDEIDIKIWMESDKDLLFTRRVDRDRARRQRTLDEIQSRYTQDVIPGFEKFIHPLRQFADVIIRNDGRNENEVPLITHMVQAYVQQRRNSSLTLHPQ